MTRKTIDDLIAEWEPQLRRAFLSSVAKIVDAAQVEAIETALRVGDVDGALRAVGIDPVRFRALDAAIAQAFESGGGLTAANIPSVRRPQSARVEILFNARNPRAEQWARDRSGTLIREIVEDQRTMVRQHLTAGLQAGNNPRAVALDLVGRIAPNGKRQGGAVGLTASQESWVRNFRAELEALDPAAMARKLRDKRFDRTFAKALESGKPMNAAKVDSMVQSYRNRALKLRADAIARTETMRALHASQEEAFRQAIDAGAVNRQDVRRVWVATKDKRTRDTHAALDGESVGLDQAFSNGLQYPGDPNGAPEETINCRCTMLMRIDFLANLR